MRRLTSAQRMRRLRIVRRRLARRALRGGYPAGSLRVSGRHRVDVVTFNAALSGIPSGQLEQSSFVDRHGRSWRCLSLVAPADFRFSSNPDEVLRFVHELRRQVFVNGRFQSRGSRQKPTLYVELDRILMIDIEGALILAAEFDRVRRVLGVRAWLDDGRWSPDVRAVLHGLGLHRIIDAKRTVESVPIADFIEPAERAGIAVIPFVSGTRADPKAAQKLRLALAEHCADPQDQAGMKVYEALIEAFNNAVAHAYLDRYPGDGLPRVRRWWAGALVSKRDGYLYLVVYDQGVGIPTTLQRRGIVEAMVGKAREKNDADVIAGALEYGRSGVSKDAVFGDEADGRGNGLARMCELTDKFPEADVRFTSILGDVRFEKGGLVERSNLQTRFGGTMVRWRAKIPARAEQD